MQKNLVIVESPAKAKTIEKFLGKDYKVMSSYGHIRDLKTKEFSIDIEHDYAPVAVPFPGPQHGGGEAGMMHRVGVKLRFQADTVPFAVDGPVLARPFGQVVGGVELQARQGGGKLH